MWIVLLNVATFLSVAVFALVGCSGDKEAEPSKPAAAKSQKSANKKVQKPKEKKAPQKTTKK